MKYKAIIVDDELASRELIHKYASKHPYVTVVDQFGSIDEAIPNIKRIKPDILFLDIEMNGENGLSLLQHFPKPSFKTIIVTAFNKYAIQAIRLSAFDYLLKPISSNLMIKTLNRFKGETEYEEQHLALGDYINNKTLGKMIIKTDAEMTMVNLDDILFIKSEGSYTVVHCSEKKHITTRSLKSYEEILPPDRFYRIHKSYLVNHFHVKTIKGKRSGLCILRNGQQLEIASRRMSFFKAWYQEQLS